MCVCVYNVYTVTLLHIAIQRCKALDKLVGATIWWNSCCFCCCCCHCQSSLATSCHLWFLTISALAVHRTRCFWFWERLQNLATKPQQQQIQKKLTMSNRKCEWLAKSTCNSWAETLRVKSVTALPPGHLLIRAGSKEPWQRSSRTSYWWHLLSWLRNVKRTCSYWRVCWII